MAHLPWNDERQEWDMEVADVRDKLPIADVIGEHVQLQNAGGVYLRGRCPFCAATGATMNVTPPRGLYYCFDCHAGGDVFSFVSAIEQVSLSEAVERLAVRAGVVLS